MLDFSDLIYKLIKSKQSIFNQFLLSLFLISSILLLISCALSYPLYYSFLATDATLDIDCCCILFS